MNMHQAAKSAGGVVLGGVIGIVGTVAHRTRLDGGLMIGLALALVAVLVAAVLARAWGSWAVFVGYGIGWVVVVQVAAVGGPGGDLLIPAQPVGYGWIYGGVLMIAIGALLPKRLFADQPIRARDDGRPRLGGRHSDVPSADASGDSGPYA